MGNQFRTTILLAGMTALLMFLGNLAGGRQGMLTALIFAGAMNFFSYWFSHKIVLKMYRAEEVTPAQAPELYQMVSDLAKNAELPMPKVCLIPKKSPNAFATGRNPENAVVAVTEGLLDLMGPEEVRGVLAHELAHVKNRDILIGTIAATMAGAIMMLASMARWGAVLGRGGDDNRGGGIGALLMSMLAPMGAMVIQMAVSRSREYLADTTGAKVAGSPEGLARALEKLGAASGRLPMHDANPATAHMFIVNPLAGGGMLSLFSTHPPLAERISRLRRMGGHTGGYQNSESASSRDQGGQDFWDKLER